MKYELHLIYTYKYNVCVLRMYMFIRVAKFCQIWASSTYHFHSGFGLPATILDHSVSQPTIG